VRPSFFGRSESHVAISFRRLGAERVITAERQGNCSGQPAAQNGRYRRSAQTRDSVRLRKSPRATGVGGRGTRAPRSEFGRSGFRHSAVSICRHARRAKRVRSARGHGRRSRTKTQRLRNRATRRDVSYCVCNSASCDCNSICTESTQASSHRDQNRGFPGECSAEASKSACDQRRVRRLAYRRSTHDLASGRQESDVGRFRKHCFHLATRRTGFPGRRSGRPPARASHPSRPSGGPH